MTTSEGKKFETRPVCGRCVGIGWVVSTYTDASAAGQCECRHAAAQLRRLSLSEIPPLYAEASLDSFLIDGYSAGARGALEVVSEFVTKYPDNPKRGLLLTGDPGSGKTHLAVAALRVLIRNGCDGLFLDCHRLLEQARASLDPEARSAIRNPLNRAREIPILLLDDLGADKASDWVKDTISSIVTHRCNYCLPLIATTNLRVGPDLAEKIGERVTSRLFQMCEIVEMPPIGDFRQRYR